MKTTLQILQEAKQVLIDKGWCQGSYMKNDVGYPVSEGISREPPASFCILGAINFVVPALTDDWIDLRSGAKRALLAQFEPQVHIPMGNDAPGRKKEEVLAIYDRAIQTLMGNPS